MPISTIDDIASALSVAQNRRIIKNITAPKASGAFHSAWLATGSPVAGATSPAFNAGSGYPCDRTTTGALGQINGAVQNWIMQAAMSCTQIGTLFIADRLWSCSGMGFANATYTVTTPGALPARITDAGAKAEIWVEQFVAAGAASGTLTVTYLDSTAISRTGVISAVVSAPVIGQMQPVPMANGLGVSQITNAINSATWTSGTWGITVLETIAQIDLPIIGVSKTLDWASLGLPPVKANACLFMYFLANGTTAPVVLGNLVIGDK